MPEINREICVSCGGCVSGYDGSKGCPSKAIEAKDHKVFINKDKCKNCGKCIDFCGLGAIEECETTC